MYALISSSRLSSLQAEEFLIRKIHDCSMMQRWRTSSGAELSTDTKLHSVAGLEGFRHRGVLMMADAVSVAV